MRRRLSANFYLALACYVAAAACTAGFLGACDSLVENVTPSGEIGAVLFAIIFAVAGRFWFWPQRFRSADE